MKRTCGLHTGRPSPGLIARLMIEKTYIICKKEWDSKGLGFRIEEIQKQNVIQAAAWADNLFTYEDLVLAAVSMAETWGMTIYKEWDAEIKVNSRQAIGECPEDRRRTQAFYPAWEIDIEMVILGSNVGADGVTTQEAYDVLRKVERAFWKNKQQLTTKGRTTQSKIWDLETKLALIWASRAASWTPSTAMLRMLNGQQQR